LPVFSATILAFSMKSSVLLSASNSAPERVEHILPLGPLKNIVSESDEIEVQIVNTIHTSVIRIQEVIENLNSFSYWVARIHLCTNSNREHIHSTIISVLCRVSENHIVVFLETINRTGRQMMSSQLTAKVNFCFPTLTKEWHLRGVFFHAPIIAQNRGVWGE